MYSDIQSKKFPMLYIGLVSDTFCVLIVSYLVLVYIEQLSKILWGTIISVVYWFLSLRICLLDPHTHTHTLLESISHC